MSAFNYVPGTATYCQILPRTTTSYCILARTIPGTTTHYYSLPRTPRTISHYQVLPRSITYAKCYQVLLHTTTTRTKVSHLRQPPQHVGPAIFILLFHHFTPHTVLLCRCLALAARDAKRVFASRAATFGCRPPTLFQVLSHVLQGTPTYYTKHYQVLLRTSYHVLHVLAGTVPEVVECSGISGRYPN